MRQSLISHATSPDNIAETIQKISDRIKKTGDKEYVSVQRQLDLLQQLSEFSFGRFLLQNQGINGYWTHYMVTHPWIGKKTGKNSDNESFSFLENFLLNRAPGVVATQQRFTIFLQENQKQVKNNAVLACVPCGMMGELLYLNFNSIDNIRLIGIDCDAQTFVDAKKLAEKQNLSHYVEFIQKDAWQLDLCNEFDLISSNGLNIYESDDDKVVELYQQFYQALKPNGKLVTSFLTIPPYATDRCEWNMAECNPDDLLLQRILLVDIINGKWRCYRSSQQTQKQLASVGFNNIEFIYDKAHMFPTVIATK